MKTITSAFEGIETVVVSGSIDELAEWAAGYKAKRAKEYALLDSIYPPKNQKFRDDAQYLRACLSEVSGLKEALTYFSLTYSDARFYEHDNSTRPPSWNWGLTSRTSPRSQGWYIRDCGGYRSYQDVDFEDKASFQKFLDGLVGRAAVTIENLAANSGKRTFPTLTQPAEQIIGKLKQVAADLVDQHDALFSPHRIRGLTAEAVVAPNLVLS